MRFLLDMGASPRTTQFLRQHGHDVVHCRELGMHQSSDEELVVRAVSEGRVIITFDLDFARILALGRAALPSLILFRLEKYTVDWANARIISTLDECEDALRQGAIVVVEPTRIRVRKLPLW